ncbi:chaperonin 10-like protein [Mycena rebaudengoi]|nr:chaperonin 10-like protein [Mycena rebaudengoi]
MSHDISWIAGNDWLAPSRDLKRDGPYLNRRSLSTNPPTPAPPTPFPLPAHWQPTRRPQAVLSRLQTSKPPKSTHIAIAATSLGQFDAIQVPTEKPGPGNVLIKVDFASMIAFDTYITDDGLYVDKYPKVLGLNVAGSVTETGEGVDDLAVGDRVIGFTLFGPNIAGAMQQFTSLSAHLCAKIPDALALDAAATIPDNFIRAFYTLFDQLSLPVPESFPPSVPPANPSTPILIYGAGATLGQYAIQLLHAAGYTNVLATASPKHHTLLRILGATGVFDYNSPSLAEDIAAAIGGDGKVALAVDPIATNRTIAKIAPLISAKGTVALLLPIKEDDSLAGSVKLLPAIPEGQNPLPEGAKAVYVGTLSYREASPSFYNQYLRDNLMPKILPQLLASGLIKPIKVRLLDQGTFKERVAAGLDLLRNNALSGEKIIVKVADTV